MFLTVFTITVLILPYLDLVKRMINLQTTSIRNCHFCYYTISLILYVYILHTIVIVFKILSFLFPKKSTGNMIYYSTYNSKLSCNTTQWALRILGILLFVLFCSSILIMLFYTFLLSCLMNLLGFHPYFYLNFSLCLFTLFILCLSFYCLC